MKKSILFLDFDGVLNSLKIVVATQVCRRSTEVVEQSLAGHSIDSGFDPVAVKLLHRLIKLTDTYIVISSSWRYNMNLKTIRSIFTEEFGWDDAEERIIGITGRSDTGRRGIEIQNWIDDHTVGIKNFKYVILDDNADMEDNQFSHFVQTDADDGFGYKDYKKALVILGFADSEDIM